MNKKYPSYTIPQSKNLQSKLFWHNLFYCSEEQLIKFCRNSLGEYKSYTSNKKAS